MKKLLLLLSLFTLNINCAELPRMNLIDAVRQNNIDEVQSYIAAKADLNARDNIGWTALMWATYCGHENMVKLLIDAKANLNIKTKILKP